MRIGYDKTILFLASLMFVFCGLTIGLTGGTLTSDSDANVILDGQRVFMPLVSATVTG
ncbi:MAG: hypothetical protein ACUZ8O_14940 [Candidatus Anammoxibacter sp.]